MPKTPAPTALSPDEIDRLLELIAQDHLFIDTLQTRHSDSLDFHDVSVWGVRSALMAAFEAGRQAARETPRGTVLRTRRPSGTEGGSASLATLHA